MTKKLKLFVRAVRIRLSHAIGMLTIGYRKIPDFLIIGAQKGGTSSLFFYLKFHNQIKRPIKKEIHYFNIHFSKGLNWYKAHFPFKSTRYITGEASPDYIFHPKAPERVKELNPKMKLIVLLRDPIQRAYSAYQMNRRLGLDPRESFEDAVQFEIDHAEKFKNKYNYERHNFFYLERGLYGKQLNHWTKTFDKENFKVIKSNDFFSNTEIIMNGIYQFLNISEKFQSTSKRMNVGKYPPISDNTRKKLKQYYDQDASILKVNWNIEF